MWVVPWLAMVALKEFLLQQKEEKLSKPGQSESKAKVVRTQKKDLPTRKRQKGWRKPDNRRGEVKRVRRYTKNYPKPRSPSHTKD